MSLTVNSLSSYTDKATQLLITNTLLADDYERYSLEDDVQYSKYLNEINSTVYPMAGTCGVTPSGTTTFSQVTITVAPVSYKMKDCFEDLQQKAIKIERQAIARGMADQNWMEILTMERTNKIKKSLENLMWVGSTVGGDLINGWFTLATAAGDKVTLDSAYSSLVQSGITVSNIDNMVQNFCDKIVATECLWGRVADGEHITIHVAPNMFNLYKQSLLAANLFRDADKNLAVKEIWVSGYEGQISIKEEPALAVASTSAKPKMLATYDKNLYIGTSLIDNITSPAASWVVDEVDDWVYFKFSLRFGAQIAFTSCVVVNY